MLMKKETFKQRFIKRVFTRFHMFLILTGTALSGVLYSKILLLLGLEHMLIRFLIVLVLAYLSFFGLMRLWLAYLTGSNQDRVTGDGLLDAADLITEIPSDMKPGMTGGGGTSGGAGASGAWDPGPSVADAAAVDGITDTAESAGNAVETVGDAAGLAEEGGMVIIVLGFLLLALFGGSVYLIYEAPVIISEAAFELALAGGLIKRARAMDDPDWVGSVFRSTWPAFILTLIIALVAGWGLMTVCPEAAKVADVIHICM